MFKRSLIVCCLGLTVALASPTEAPAGDRYGVDDANYLLVAYHFTYPIGALISNGIFRPFLTVAEKINPRPVPGGERGVRSHCRDLRPTRSCGGPARSRY